MDADERSSANGLTNVARSVGACLGPLCTGMLFEANGPSSAYPFLVAGSLKIIYDLLLLYNMQGVPTAGEVAKAQAKAQAHPSHSSHGLMDDSSTHTHTPTATHDPNHDGLGGGDNPMHDGCDGDEGMEGVEVVEFLRQGGGAGAYVIDAKEEEGDDEDSVTL